jgi:hypothetical protein
MVDVSRAPGSQSEAAVAVDPHDPNVLLAGSNDLGSRLMRVYSSVDGGSRWASTHLTAPPVGDLCGTSDPGVAIAADGTQYYSFLGIHCSGRRARGTSVYLDRRSSATSDWEAIRLPVSSGDKTTLADDRPSIVVDDSASGGRAGRVYVAWSRFKFDTSSIWADPDEQQVEPVLVSALVSHSDNRGRTWSKPVTLSSRGEPLEVRLAIAEDGGVYAAWRDARTNGIYISSSKDGDSFGAPKLVAAAVVDPLRSCHEARARIPAQPRRCVSPNPVITIDDRGDRGDWRIYVVWGSTALNRSQDVDIASFTADLTPKLGVGRVRQVNRVEGISGPDQFLPTAAVDPRTGRLWACFYESLMRRPASARFSCTASDDGGRSWSSAISAAASPSDESQRPANVANGYGDYESAVVSGRALVAMWTDGSRLKARREEIVATRISAERAGER